jgi:hypothetical protein
VSLLDSDAAFNCEVIRDCYEAFALYCFERYLIACLGGEESTIEFMESESLIDSNTPLLKEAYAYGVVEHPFPLNCFLRYWYLGRDFYNAVKIGIVQYVCAHFLIESYCRFLFLLHFTASVWYLLRHYFPDDIKDDLCTASNDSRNFWGLWRREV